MQIFTAPPRRWATGGVSDRESEEFRRALAATDVRVTVAHDSYLINLASPHPALYRRSLAAFRAELERCRSLGIDLLVTHPGSATDGRREEGMRRNALAVAEAIAEVEGRCAVLLETAAGGGNTLGWRFEEIAAILEEIPVPQRGRVAVCLDTCHVFAAGYDLRGDPAEVVDLFDRIIGLPRLRLLHLNDSVAALGSRRDRHAHIGRGEIGEEAFRALMRGRRIRHVPRVIETPKGDDPTAADRGNLELLRRMAAGG
jgi:deoxyribonuclease-4